MVIERNVDPRLRALPGDPLFRIADHSVVWVLADIAERDLAMSSSASRSRCRSRGYPGRVFKGKVDAHLSAPERRDPHGPCAGRAGPTRTASAARHVCRRRDRDRRQRAPVLTVPDSAVIDTRHAPGRARRQERGPVRAAGSQARPAGDGYVEIREGVAKARAVVVSANFLIDAESNLKSALKAFPTAEAGQP